MLIFLINKTIVDKKTIICFVRSVPEGWDPIDDKPTITDDKTTTADDNFVLVQGKRQKQDIGTVGTPWIKVNANQSLSLPSC